jgi:Phosphodiester glycosidase
MDQVAPNQAKRLRSAWRYVLGAGLVFVLAAVAIVAVIPAVLPSVGAQAADLLRSALGPDAVASLEIVSFRIQDAVNQSLYSITGSRPSITLGGGDSTGGGSGLLAPQPNSRIARISNAVSASPQIGWRSLGPSVDSAPAMAQALLHPDPQRPYAGIALVRIDLSKLSLHMMPGFQEPAHSQNVLKSIPNIGLTPAADVAHLVAGFNGGFKAVNGHYGMMVDGTTLLPPVPGIATIAIYQDGRVRIGAWGTDILPSPDLIAYRQNCPPIVETGQLNPEVSVDNRAVWGNTVGNREITWRTGLGITQDGRYLIYAVGNATTVSTLAQALQAAGAYNAMQLDINQHFAHFATFQADARGRLVPVQLLSQMENAPALYLSPELRDYFYLTTK